MSYSNVPFLLLLRASKADVAINKYGQEYYTHEFHITNKMEKKGKLYRQVWGKVTEEMLQQYRMVAEDLNRRYRY